MKLHKLYDLRGLTKAHKKVFKRLCDSLLDNGYGFMLDEYADEGLVLHSADGVARLGVQPVGAYRQMFCTETGLWGDSYHTFEVFPIPEKRIFNRYATPRMNSWEKKHFRELCDTFNTETDIRLLNQLTTVLRDDVTHTYVLAAISDAKVSYVLTDSGVIKVGPSGLPNHQIAFGIPPVKESVYLLEETLLWQKQYNAALNTAVANFEENSDLHVQEKRKAVFKLT